MNTSSIWLSTTPTKTKARSRQTNSICERFQKTIQDEFYAVAFRKKLYDNLKELQKDLDIWLNHYKKQRTHTGKYCFGKMPYQTFLEGIPLAQEKMLDRLNQILIKHFFRNQTFQLNAKGWWRKKMSQTKLAHENFLLDAPVR